MAVRYALYGRFHVILDIIDFRGEVPPIALQNAFWGCISAIRDKPWRQADLFYMNGVKPLIFNVFWGQQVL